MRNTLIGASGIAVMIALSSPASAVHISLFKTSFVPLSGSGVTGDALLKLDTNAETLAVRIRASGLVPNMVHVQHIHGQFDGMGNPIDSTTPTLAQDTDGDGFIELAEGLVTYGPIIVPLSSPPGGALANFPTAPDGTINFFETYDLNDPATFAMGFSKEDLFPLTFREIVLHGAFDPVGVGVAPGEVDGMDGYEPTLPVASGEIVEAIPLPAAGWLLLSALAGLGLLGRSAAHRREV